MRQHQRSSDAQARLQGDPACNPGADLSQVRESAQQLAAAADAAISAAISGDSESFLASSRQRSAQ